VNSFTQSRQVGKDRKGGAHCVFANLATLREKYYALVTVSAFTTGLVILLAFAGLLLPNEPWNLFPFAVFLSPLPMICFLRMKREDRKIAVYRSANKKPRVSAGSVSSSFRLELGA
jgi:hypothetical protein